MNASTKIDHALIVQWIFGMVVVVMYARDRFESPAPLRCTTTFLHYWAARIGYMLTLFAIFLILGGAVTAVDPKWILTVLNVGDFVKDAGALPGPLLSALLLTSLLPHFPYLSKIDDIVKRWFQRVGNIPSEVRRLSACIQGTIGDMTQRPARRASCCAQEVARLRASTARAKCHSVVNTGCCRRRR